VFSVTSIKSYLYLLQTFTNGTELIQNLRKGGMRSDGPICRSANLRSGGSIIHPDSPGLVGTLLEVWHWRCYDDGTFYEFRKGDVIVDAGANIGTFSLDFARRNPSARILAFEPFPETFSCLKANVESLGLTDHIDLRNEALGAESGHAKPIGDTDRAVDGTTQEADADDPDAVSMATLDSVLAEDGIDEIALLKMDIEGGEEPIFEAIRPGTLAKIRCISMEYHDNLRPGVLKLIQKRLADTHDVRVIKEEDDEGNELPYGMLHAGRRS